MKIIKLTPKQFVLRFYPDAVCERISAGPFAYYQITTMHKGYHKLGSGGTEKYAWIDTRQKIIEAQLKEQTT